MLNPSRDASQLCNIRSVHRVFFFFYFSFFSIFYFLFWERVAVPWRRRLVPRGFCRVESATTTHATWPGPRFLVVSSSSWSSRAASEFPFFLCCAEQIASDVWWFLAGAENGNGEGSSTCACHRSCRCGFPFFFFPLFCCLLWMFDHRTISFGLPQVSLSFSISSCVPVLGYCVRKLEDSLPLSQTHAHFLAPPCVMTMWNALVLVRLAWEICEESKRWRSFWNFWNRVFFLKSWGISEGCLVIWNLRILLQEKFCGCFNCFVYDACLWISNFADPLHKGSCFEKKSNIQSA